MATKFLYHNQYPKRPELEVSSSNFKLNVLRLYQYFLHLTGVEEKCFPWSIYL